MRKTYQFFLRTAALAAGLCLSHVSAQEKEGDTRVAQWRYDRTAAFLLMFDDSWPSHWQVAAPELASRGMTATFYVCPGKGEYQKFASKWEKDLPEMGMVLGDHTMTHRGVKDLENGRYEIGECANVIRKIQPSRAGKLVSYAQPGVGKDDWKITGPELKQILDENKLISRPPFTDHGAVYHQKTLEEMVALADKAIAKKGMEYLVVHGVERIKENWGYQDMWALKQDIYIPLLDSLKERQDKGDLWITDHISQHQYETERDQAELRTLESKKDLIQVELKSKADAELYDYPLTLVTKVPADWKKAEVTQGDSKSTVNVVEGLVRYDVIPNAATIAIRPSRE